VYISDCNQLGRTYQWLLSAVRLKKSDIS